MPNEIPKEAQELSDITNEVYISMLNVERECLQWSHRIYYKMAKGGCDMELFKKNILRARELSAELEKLICPPK